MEMRPGGPSRWTRVAVVVALLLWLVWFLTTVGPLIGLVPVTAVVRSGIPFGAALPAAILATMFALYLARADAPPAAQRPVVTTPPVDTGRLRRQALVTAGISLFLWTAVVFSLTEIGPDIMGGLRLPMVVGAALFSALAASALRQARVGGSVSTIISVIGRTATIVSLVVVLLALGWTVVLWLLLRDPF